jgi:hypothetical protein
VWNRIILGLLPASEFLKLVENESAEIRSAIFYDNVRHWQEWNPVNTGNAHDPFGCWLQSAFSLVE